jgi:hypothetical protein
VHATSEPLRLKRQHVCVHVCVHMCVHVCGRFYSLLDAFDGVAGF